MRWYYGWNVAAAVFVMAALSFGLGFHGMTVYVATLQAPAGLVDGDGGGARDAVLLRERAGDDDHR